MVGTMKHPTLKSISLHVVISGNRRSISSVREAMLPESGLGLRKANDTERCSFTINEEDPGYLSLGFSALDAISLRASMNTNLRLISSAFRTIGATSKLPYASLSLRTDPLEGQMDPAQKDLKKERPKKLPRNDSKREG